MVWRNSFDWAPVTNVDSKSFRHVVEGGRCGGSPPAQGRAEGPTAQRQGESADSSCVQNWPKTDRGWVAARKYARVRTHLGMHPAKPILSQICKTVGPVFLSLFQLRVTKAIDHAIKPVITCIFREGDVLRVCQNKQEYCSSPYVVSGRVPGIVQYQSVMVDHDSHIFYRQATLFTCSHQQESSRGNVRSI